MRLLKEQKEAKDLLRAQNSLWDRLPMTVAFTLITSLVVFEHLNEAWGRRLLVPLLAVGILSILFWVWKNDLRFYGLVQFYPILAIPIILLAFRGPGTRYYWLCLLCYALAKVLEVVDVPVFRLLGGTFSGHTLKHLVAGIASLFITLKFREQSMTERFP